MSLKILLSGALGRMGRAVAAQAELKNRGEPLGSWGKI